MEFFYYDYAKLKFKMLERFCYSDEDFSQITFNLLKILSYLCLSVFICG